MQRQVREVLHCIAPTASVPSAIRGHHTRTQGLHESTDRARLRLWLSLQKPDESGWALSLTLKVRGLVTYRALTKKPGPRTYLSLDARDIFRGTEIRLKPELSSTRHFLANGHKSRKIFADVMEGSALS